jgi:hypothetical protein
MKQYFLGVLCGLAWCAQGVVPHKKHHFAFEVVNGMAMVTGTPESETESPAPVTGQTWKNFGVELGPVQPIALPAINTNQVVVEMDMPGGYRANWDAMPQTKKQPGFTGQLNMHYMMYANNWGMGVYGGVGYTGGSVSAQSVVNFDQNVYKNGFYIRNSSSTDSLTLEVGTYTVSQLKTAPTNIDSIDRGAGERTSSSIASDQALVANWPAARVTVKPGLSLQAGIRLGRMVGNFYPHVRLGWAAYNMRATLVNQMRAGSRQANVYGYCAQQDKGGVQSNGTVYNNQIGTYYDAERGQNINTTYIECTNDVGAWDPIGNLAIDNGDKELEGINVPTQMLTPFYTSEGLTNMSSTSRWANAVTLGLGLDWTKGKWVLGAFYQVALCQRVLFKSWNKDVSAGITNASVDFAGADWTMTSNNSTNMEKTGRTLVATYGAKTPEFSVKPVIQTFMLTVKYCF